jgi:hypothetical protein
MFSALTKEDVNRAYPKLHLWQLTRYEITNKGTSHTFDNDFSLRCDLISRDFRLGHTVVGPLPTD